MAVTAQMVKELREMTGAGMMDCKKALVECEGDIEKSIDWLRKKGVAKAEKKEGRTAAEGLTRVLIDGNKAVIVEVNSETDFVAKNEKFQALLDLCAKTILANEPADVEAAGSLRRSAAAALGPSDAGVPPRRQSGKEQQECSAASALPRNTSGRSSAACRYPGAESVSLPDTASPQRKPCRSYSRGRPGEEQVQKSPPRADPERPGGRDAAAHPNPGCPPAEAYGAAYRRE